MHFPAPYYIARGPWLSAEVARWSPAVVTVRTAGRIFDCRFLWKAVYAAIARHQGVAALPFARR